MDFTEIRPTSLCSVSAAILSNSLEIFERLLKEKKPVDVKDNRGYFPIHVAIGSRHNHIDTAFLKLLVGDERCSNLIDEKSFDGATPLMLAVCVNDVDKVRVLLESGANPNCADHSGTTPLMWAVKSCASDTSHDTGGGLGIVQTLLAHQADVNQQDIDDESVCHYVARDCRDTRILDVLVFHDVQLDVQNCWKTNMLHIAAYFINDIIVSHMCGRLVEKHKELRPVVCSMLSVKDVNGNRPLEIVTNIGDGSGSEYETVIHHFLQLMDPSVMDIVSVSAVRRLHVMGSEDLTDIIHNLHSMGVISMCDDRLDWQRIRTRVLFNLVTKVPFDADLLSRYLDMFPDTTRVSSLSEQYTYFSSICPLGYAVTLGDGRRLSTLLKYFLSHAASSYTESMHHQTPLLTNVLSSYPSHVLNPLQLVFVTANMTCAADPDTTCHNTLDIISSCDQEFRLSSLHLLERLFRDHINVVRHSQFSQPALHRLVRCGLEVRSGVFQTLVDPFQSTYACTALCGLMNQFGDRAGGEGRVVRPHLLDYLVFVCAGNARLCKHLAAALGGSRYLREPRSLAHQARATLHRLLPVSVLRDVSRVKEVTRLPAPLLTYLMFEDVESEQWVGAAGSGEQSAESGFSGGLVRVQYDGVAFREMS